MATNTFIDRSTINALLTDSDMTVDSEAPASPSPGNIWWDSNAIPFVRRVYIAGQWEDSGGRFDPISGQISMVQAGVGLNLNGPQMDLDIQSLPLAP